MYYFKHTHTLSLTNTHSQSIHNLLIWLIFPFRIVACPKYISQCEARSRCSCSACGIHFWDYSLYHSINLHEYQSTLKSLHFCSIRGLIANWMRTTETRLRSRLRSTTTNALHFGTHTQAYWYTHPHRHRHLQCTYSTILPLWRLKNGVDANVFMRCTTNAAAFSTRTDCQFDSSWRHSPKWNVMEVERQQNSTVSFPARQNSNRRCCCRRLRYGQKSHATNLVMRELLSAK